MSTGWSNENQSAVFGQGATGVSFDEGLRKHMLRVYNMVGGGIAVAGLAALATVHVAHGPLTDPRLAGTRSAHADGRADRPQRAQARPLRAEFCCQRSRQAW